jgi:preprotein translocase subunit SecA
MMDAIKEELASLVFNVQVNVEDGKKVSAPSLEAKPAQVSALTYTASDESGVVTKSEVTRNAPCPCGSGKKYKRCHGAA